jgi:hypothetical protein
VDVGRIAGEENAARTIARGLAMVQPEVTEPGRIAEDEPSSCGIVYDPLQLLE